MLIGLATSFFNNKNHNLVRELVSLLVEANQELPPWLEDLFAEVRYSSGCSRRPGSTKGRFSGGFGARDYRQQPSGGSTRNNGPSSRPGSYGGKVNFFSLFFFLSFKFIPIFTPFKNECFSHES